MKLYLAGPLFSTAERTFNTQLRDLLIVAGHEVWLPQDKEPREKTAKAIFLMDVEGIDWCDVVVACMDGPDPDSGTCWECGYAYHKKKIICYRTDFRSATEHGAVGQDMDEPVKGLAPFNLMLSESADRLVLSPFATIGDLVSNLRYALDCIKEPCWMCKDEAKTFVEMAALEYALRGHKVVFPADLRCQKCRRVVHYETEPTPPTSDFQEHY